MRHVFSDLVQAFNENPGRSLVCWSTCYMRRDPLKRTQRDIPPVLCEITMNHTSPWRSLTILDHETRQRMDYEGNARGSYLVFFTTREEAVDHYNTCIDEALQELDNAIVRLQRDRKKIEARRLP